jgi:hypothetical protein
MITETGTPSRPTTITASFFGYLLSTLASVITGVIIMTSRQQLLDALRTANDSNTKRLTEDQLQHAASLGQITAMVVVVVFALVYLLLAFRLRAGRNWARIVLTVFVAFQVISSLATLQGTSVVSYIGTGISVIATVLAYLPDSNSYIRQVKQAR